MGGGIDIDEATALPDHVLYPYTAGTHGSDELMQGTIQSMAGRTITPSSAAQTISCKGKYMTGDIIVAADPHLTAGTYYFINGTSFGSLNPNGLSFYSVGVGCMQISFRNSSAYQIATNTLNSVNFSGYNKLNLQVNIPSKSSGNNESILIELLNLSGGVVGSTSATVTSLFGGTKYVLSINTASINYNCHIRIRQTQYNATSGTTLCIYSMYMTV